MGGHLFRLIKVAFKWSDMELKNKFIGQILSIMDILHGNFENHKQSSITNH